MGYVRSLVFGLALLSPQLGYSQAEARNLPRFRLLLTSGDRVEGRAGVLTDTALVGQTAAGAPLSIRRADIRVLDVRTGSSAGKGALIGSSIGLLTGLLAILQASATPNAVVDTDAATKITVGLTLGGGIIGFLVGSGNSRWDRVPLNLALWVDPAGKGAAGRVMVSF